MAISQNVSSVLGQHVIGQLPEGVTDLERRAVLEAFEQTREAGPAAHAQMRDIIRQDYPLLALPPG